MLRSIGKIRQTTVICFGLALAGLILPLATGCDRGQIATFGLKEAALVTGAGPVTFERFLSLPPLQEGGEVHIGVVLPTDDPNILALRCHESSSDGEISIGMIRFIQSGSASEITSQQPPSYRCSPEDIRTTGDLVGVCHYEGEVGVIDSEGKGLWWTSESLPDGERNEGGEPFRIDAGDIDGDGDREFCVAFTKSLGCFDEAGATLWRVMDNRDYLSVSIVSRTSASPMVLTVSGYPTYLEARDGSGGLLSRAEVQTGYGDEFDLVSWPPESEAPSLMSKAGWQLVFRNWAGTIVAEYPIPRALTEFESSVIDSAVTSIDGTPFLVINFAAELAYRKWDIVGWAWPVRSALVVYDAGGNVVHFEVLDDVVYLSSPVPGGPVYLPYDSSLYVLQPPISDSASEGEFVLAPVSDQARISAP